MKGRIFIYDIYRALACLMIIIVHSPHSNNPERYGHYYAAITYTMMVGVCLFFMISGALLLPTKLSTTEFFKKRLDKVVGPIVFWTIVYSVYQYFVEDSHLADLATNLFGLFFCYQGGVELWFMYDLLGIYLLVPMLSPYLAKATKREYEIYLFLWFVSLTIPYLSLIWNVSRHSGLFTYMFGFAGYFLLGAYLHKFYEQTIFAKRTWLSIMFCISIWIFTIGMIKLGKLDNATAFMSCIALPMASLTLAFYLFIRKVYVPLSSNSILYKITVNISTLSFGIYLSHVYISQRLLWKWDWLINQHILVEVFICSVISFLVSWSLSFLFSKTKFSKFTIGV